MDKKGILITFLAGATLIALPYAVMYLISIMNPPAPVKATVELPPTSTELLTLVNKERAMVGVAPLKLNPILGASAQYKADDMFVNNYFSHTGLDGTMNGLDFLEANQQGLCSYVSENLHMREVDTTSEVAVNEWMGSEPHRLAMLDAKYTYTGFGIAGNKVVEHFCVAN